MEASLNGQIKIVKELFDRFNVAVDKVGDVLHFGSLVKGATALWCAAGQYIILSINICSIIK